VNISYGIRAGVWFETFVVRSLMTPSIAAIAGRGIWWPSASAEPTSAHHVTGGRAAHETLV
jgi:RND superfamily putative drug exporter